MHAGAVFHPKLAQEITRYFPMFWDSSTGFVVLDLNDRNNHRVMLLEFEDVEGTQEAYPSFEEFIRNVIRAWSEGESMDEVRRK